MPLYEVVLRGSYFGQQTVNRWNYVSSGGSGAALPSFGLAVGFGVPPVSDLFTTTSILRLLQGNISDNFVFESLQVKNVYDPTDFYEAFFAPSVKGEIDSSDGLSPINAVGFVSTQTTLAVRKGHKRFAGVTENNVGDGGVLTSGAITAFSDLSTAMSALLAYTADGATLQFAPAVVSKESYVSHTDPVRHSSRYYADEATQLEHTAWPVVWSLTDTVRSQVSRQYGRGI